MEPNGKGEETTNSKIPSIFDHVDRNSSTIKSNYHLVRDEAVETLRQVVEEQYPVRTGLQASIDICRAAGGPGSAVQDR